MIAEIVHLRLETLLLVVHMLETVNRTISASSSDTVITLSEETAWGLPDGARTAASRSIGGKTTISTGRSADHHSLVIDDNLLPWTGSDVRPTLAQIRDVLIAVGHGRQRSDDDPIEILARDLAAQLAQNRPTPPGGGNSVLPSDNPYVLVKAPCFGPATATIVWKGIGIEKVDDRYSPSPALKTRMNLLPTEFGLNHVSRSLTCDVRECRAPIPLLDTIGIIRALSVSTLSQGERLERTR